MPLGPSPARRKAIVEWRRKVADLDPAHAALLREYEAATAAAGTRKDTAGSFETALTALRADEALSLLEELKDMPT